MNLQRNSKDDTEIAQSQRPYYQLPPTKTEGAILAFGQQELYGRNLVIHGDRLAHGSREVHPPHLETMLTTPTRPHPSGIIPMLPATVWTRTFSTGENGSLRCFESSLKKPKPIKLAGIAMMLTHPLWRPIEMLVHAKTRPMASPTATPLAVKLRPSMCRGPCPLRTARVGVTGLEEEGLPLPEPRSGAMVMI
jgi:hypothetical protein